MSCSINCVAASSSYTDALVNAPEKILLAAPRGYCAGVDRAVETVERALEKHGPPVYVRHEIVHNTYVVNLNNLVPGTEFEGKSLEEIIKKSSGGIYNNAAQIWNHTFFWNGMKPQGGGEPSGALADAINAATRRWMGWRRASWWRWTAWTRWPATARTRSRCSISTTARALRA